MSGKQGNRRQETGNRKQEAGSGSRQEAGEVRSRDQEKGFGLPFALLDDVAKPGRQDLVARARRFSVRLLQLTAHLLRDPTLPRRVVEQLAGAGTAIGNNIAEAQTATSRKQMACAYAIALREAKEARHELEVIRDLAKADPIELQWLIGEADEFTAILFVSIRHLRR